MPTPRLRLGQLLVDARLISAAALDEVLAAQRADGRRLGTLLVERGLINETQLTQILSHQLSVPWVSLLHIEFSRQLLNLVPREVADRYCLVPIYVRHVRNQGETLYVAMDDPSNEEGLKACRDHSGLPVRSMIAPPADIRSAIRVYYGVDSRPAPEGQPITQPAPPPPTAPSVREPETKREPPAPAPAPVEAKPAPVEAVPEPAPPRAEEAAPAPVEEAAPPRPRSGPASVDGPEIEAVEISLDLTNADRLRGIIEPSPTPVPPSSPQVENIPLPRGRAPRMVSLTLLDGTTINLPAKRRQRRPLPGEEAPAVEPRAVSPSSPPLAGGSEPPAAGDSIHGLTARDLVLALRVVANGADASEVLGENLRWEALFSALLSLMLKKHLIADWEFIDELKKQL